MRGRGAGRGRERLLTDAPVKGNGTAVATITAAPMIGSLDMDGLRAFVAIVDSMSFSRAGEAIGRSQSAISLRLRQLERSLGGSLLVRRQGRVIEVTAKGRILLGYARDILGLNDAALRDLTSESRRERVRLGVPADFLEIGLAEALQRTRALFPDLHLEIETGVSERLRGRCLSGDLDAAFYKQAAADGHGLPLMRIPLRWVAAPGVTLADSAPVPLICFPEGCVYRQRMVHALRAAGRDWRMVMTTPCLDTLRRAVAAGMGLTALPMTGERLVPVSGLPALEDVILAMALAPGERPLVRRVVGGLAGALFPLGHPEAPPRRDRAARAAVDGPAGPPARVLNVA